MGDIFWTGKISFFWGWGGGGGGGLEIFLEVNGRCRAGAYI